MTSYMTSCSVKIGGFCYLLHLGEFYCLLEWVFALQAALMVFRDVEKLYTDLESAPTNGLCTTCHVPKSAEVI